MNHLSRVLRVILMVALVPGFANFSTKEAIGHIIAQDGSKPHLNYGA